MEVKKTNKKIIYPVFEMEDKGRLIIPAEVLSQITFLHSHCGDTEWSGMLMYDVTGGNVSKPKGLELEAKHIFLMDIGTAGGTEYETDGDIVDIYDHFDEAMDWKMGNVHTHHNMGTGFSGIDMDELQDNVDKHNYYLSLIVNFKGNFTAKVAFLSDMKTSSQMSYVSDKGDSKLFTQNVNRTHMVIINMKIYFGGVTVFFSGRVITIKKRKEEEDKKQRSARELKSFERNNNDFWTHRREIVAPDPSVITKYEIDQLSIAVLSYSTEIHSEVTMYSIISMLTREDETSVEIYFDHVIENIDDVIFGFFGKMLTINEYKTVIEEIVEYVEDYKAIDGLQSTVFDIVECLSAAFTAYTEKISGTEQELDFEAKEIKEGLQ